MPDSPSSQAPVRALDTVSTDRSANGSPPGPPGNVLAVQLDVAALRSELRALKASNAGKAKRDAAAIDWRKRGRTLRRLVTMFNSVDDLIREAHRRDSRDSTASLAHTGSEPAAQTAAERQEQSRLYRCYQQLREWVPKLIEWLGQDPDIDLYHEVICKVDDTNTLKSTVVTWLDYPDAAIPRLHPRDKAGQGFHNYVTGHLLCPVEYDWDNAEVRKMIQQWDRDVPITAYSWPCFLFPTGGYDPADANKGLFRGELLVKAYKLVFMGPSSVESTEDVPSEIAGNKRQRVDASTRRHNAQLAGMKQVTPRSIAYIAVQLRFALSSCGTWRLDDDLFSLAVFYNMIIKWFEMMYQDDKELVDNLIWWWNKEVFGPRVGLTHCQLPIETGSIAASFKRYRT
ncbi:hypothetical protein HD554DRAFT_2315774 [Boletus coccyginus]|nr:hypothetical protein HD554DRAFT_2315774 [Boletus coccyginus]